MRPPILEISVKIFPVGPAGLGSGMQDSFVLVKKSISQLVVLGDDSQWWRGWSGD